MKNLKKYALLSVSTLLMVSTLVGCGTTYSAYDTITAQSVAGSSKYDSFGYEDYDVDYGYTSANSVTYSNEEDYYSNGGSSDSDTMTEAQLGASVATNRKLIRTVNVDVETTEFDIFVSGLNTSIASLGGYIENEYTYNGSAYNKSGRDMKRASFTIRVPEDKVDALLATIGGAGSITQKSTSTEDVTLNYVDTQSKKEMYLAEQESLLALLEKAESIEDIVYLTERLSQVRHNIESMESSLRVYDDLVAMSTVYLDLTEVEIYTPVVIEEKSIGDQISEGFKANLMDVVFGIRDFFVNLIIVSPYIIRFFVIIGIIAGVIVIIVNVIKFNIKKSNKKKEEAKKKYTEMLEKEKEEK